MKKLIAAVAFLGLVGCVPKLPDIPEITAPEIPEVPEIAVPEIAVPELEVPTTLPAPIPGDPSFKNMCIAGFVETSPGKGTLDIYSPTEWSNDIQSIADVSVSTVNELDLLPC